MPGRRRASGDEALLFLDDIRQHLTLIALNQHEYFQIAEAAAAGHLAGGAIYDAILGHCALKANAEAIYTWNTRDFLLSAFTDCRSREESRPPVIAGGMDLTELAPDGGREARVGVSFRAPLWLPTGPNHLTSKDFRSITSNWPSVFQVPPVAVLPSVSGLGRLTRCSAATNPLAARSAPTLVRSASRSGSISCETTPGCTSRPISCGRRAQPDFAAVGRGDVGSPQAQVMALQESVQHLFKRQVLRAGPKR